MELLYFFHIGQNRGCPRKRYNIQNEAGWCCYTYQWDHLRHRDQAISPFNLIDSENSSLLFTSLALLPIILSSFVLFFSLLSSVDDNYVWVLCFHLYLQINSYQGYGRQFIRLALMKRLLPYTVQSLANSPILKVIICRGLIYYTTNERKNQHFNLLWT